MQDETDVGVAPKDGIVLRQWRRIPSPIRAVLSGVFVYRATAVYLIEAWSGMPFPPVRAEALSARRSGTARRISQTPNRA